MVVQVVQAEVLRVLVNPASHASRPSSERLVLGAGLPAALLAAELELGRPKDVGAASPCTDSAGTAAGPAGACGVDAAGVRINA